MQNRIEARTSRASGDRGRTQVSVADVHVAHEVKLGDFTKWPDRMGGSPREVSDRHRIQSILAMPVSR